MNSFPKVHENEASVSPSNNYEESFEQRVKAACWGIPEPDNVDCDELADIAQRIQELVEAHPNMEPDEYFGTGKSKRPVVTDPAKLE